MNSKQILLAGAVLGFLGVALGAVGAHALQASLTEAELRQYEIAVRYHFLHALALLAIGVLARQAGQVLAQGQSKHQPPSFAVPAGLLLLGTSLFSGSLYALALTGAHWLVFITPVGGLCLLAGWAAMIWSLFKL